MNLNNIAGIVIDRVFNQGKKKTLEATGILVLILSHWIPEELARDIITGIGAIWAAYKLYDKD
jgi:hypothetical protein